MIDIELGNKLIGRGTSRMQEIQKFIYAYSFPGIAWWSAHHVELCQRLKFKKVLAFTFVIIF